jgi:hypothetical protein
MRQGNHGVPIEVLIVRLINLFVLFIRIAFVPAGDKEGTSFLLFSQILYNRVRSSQAKGTSGLLPSQVQLATPLRSSQPLSLSEYRNGTLQGA